MIKLLIDKIIKIILYFIEKKPNNNHICSNIETKKKIKKIIRHNKFVQFMTSYTIPSSIVCEIIIIKRKCKHCENIEYFTDYGNDSINKSTKEEIFLFD